MSSSSRCALLLTLSVVAGCSGDPVAPFAAAGAAGVAGVAAGGAGAAGAPNGGAGIGSAGIGGAGVAGAGAGGSAGSVVVAAGGAGESSGGVAGGSGVSGASPGGVGGVSSGGAGTGFGGTAGGAGSAGSSAGSGGGSGNAGGGGNTGSPVSLCPSGPFPAPMVLSTTDVCEGFDLRYSWNEGPTWVASEGAFFFTNFVAGSGSGGDIVKYTPGGSCERFIPDVGCNGLAVSNDGGLLAACQQTRSVVRFDLATKQPTTLASTYMGMMLDTPNDLVQHSNGSIYFTNPTNELDGRPVGVGAAAFRLDPDGMLDMIGQGNCNGIALSPDERTLYVIQLGMWDLDPSGVPSNRQSLFTSGDGIAVDCGGNVYANGDIYDAGGERIGSWGNGTNLSFGGEDGKTVLVVGRGTPLRELSVNVPGLP